MAVRKKKKTVHRVVSVLYQDFRKRSKACVGLRNVPMFRPQELMHASHSYDFCHFEIISEACMCRRCNISFFFPSVFFCAVSHDC